MQYKSILACTVSPRGRGSRGEDSLTVAAYPAVDQIVKDSLAVWSKITQTLR